MQLGRVLASRVQVLDAATAEVFNQVGVGVVLVVVVFFTWSASVRVRLSERNSHCGVKVATCGRTRSAPESSLSIGRPT
jgi:hypothetical protein